MWHDAANIYDRPHKGGVGVFPLWLVRLTRTSAVFGVQYEIVADGRSIALIVRSNQYDKISI